MKEIYAKVMLYSYRHLPKIADQIDDLVEKKALSSISDCSPAMAQYQKIVRLTYQKQIVLSLSLNVKTVLGKFSEAEREYFEYKYFRGINPAKNYSFDPSSRNYFRVQNRLIKKFAGFAEKIGYGDERVEKELLSVEFFREMLKRAEEKENADRKHAEVLLAFNREKRAKTA